MSTKRATLKNSNHQLFILFVPFILAWFADHGYGFIFKAGVPFSCALIIGFSIRFRFNAGFRQDWYVIAALFFSVIGDWFLSFKDDNIVRFTLGIGFYFFAHVGYLGYALATGRPDKLNTLVLLAGYLLFFFFRLYPAIESTVLFAAVLLYLLVSCLTLGASVGMNQMAMVKWSYVAGIALILFSDTIIAFHEFTSYQELNFLILPTYYAAHIVITFSILKKRMSSTGV